MRQVTIRMFYAFLIIYTPFKAALFLYVVFFFSMNLALH